MEKKMIAAFAALAIQLSVPATGEAQGRAALVPDSLRVRRDIEFLASDKLEGGGTGTAGQDTAAAYAARRYTSLGLRSYSPGFLQHYIARSAVLAHNGAPSELATQNVVAYVPGTDARLGGEAIVIGAHLDHLGRSTVGALDPEAKDAIRNGADDNASGSAAVLELARLISAKPLRRSVVFVNFSGEELGLLGSQYFVEHSPLPLDSVVAMLNFDMVGRMRGDSLIVYGVGTAKEMPAVLDSANMRVGLKIRGLPDGFGPSDHSSFYAHDIPVLHFFSNLHEDYHRATDDADKINAAGEAKVIALAERVAREIDRRDSRLSFIRMAAPPPVAAGSGSNVYLGSIPDMAAPEGVKGLKLTGVRAGCPADSGGLKAGDIIVDFGGKPVVDLQSYSDALYSYKPGDVVDIVVVRGNERVKLSVKLGRRGS
jgi:Zn-dependent M28 family amino/carboxypeptidase